MKTTQFIIEENRDGNFTLDKSEMGDSSIVIIPLGVYPSINDAHKAMQPHIEKLRIKLVFNIHGERQDELCLGLDL